MGNALRKAGPAGRQRRENLPAKEVAVKAQIFITRIFYGRKGQALRSSLKTRPGLGEPGAKEPPPAKGPARRHGPQPPKSRAPEQAKKDRLGLIVLVVRQEQRLPHAQQGFEDLIARGPGRGLEPRRARTHRYANAMPGEAQGYGNPSHFGLRPIGVGSKPVIHMHHPRGRPPRLPAMPHRYVKEREGIEPPGAGDPEPLWRRRQGRP